MLTPEELEDLYIDELKDLWSANDQMQKALIKITAKASDATRKDMLAKSQVGIAKHTDILKKLITGQDEKVSKEHCMSSRWVSRVRWPSQSLRYAPAGTSR